MDYGHRHKRAEKVEGAHRFALAGVLPDLVVFSVPAVVRIWRFLTGASKTLLPDGSGLHFD
jgi:hypothetical protein